MVPSNWSTFVRIHLQVLILALTAPFLASASLNTTRSYHLRTCLKPNQTRDKHVYENLYPISYHTGAGFGDAVLVNNATYAAKGFLNGTSQEFDLGNGTPRQNERSSAHVRGC